MRDSERYSRQILVEKIGLDGQKKLQSAKVLIVGAGGLGCTVAAQLAGAGVGELKIVDHDSVSISNLHRQVLFRESDIGDPKAKVVARELLAINSSCNIIAHAQRLSSRNADTLCDGMGVVVDAADNFVTTYLLSDRCLDLNTPLVSASVNRTFGYVGQFCCDAPSVRAVFPRLPKQAQNCDTVGVTGPSVGVIASLQAQEILKALIGDETQLRGKLLYADLWNYSQQIIDVSRAPEPEHAQLRLVSRDKICERDIVIDVRTPGEFQQSPNAFEQVENIPLSQLFETSFEYPKDQRIVLACQSGQRALIAAQHMLDQGFNQVAALIPE